MTFDYIIILSASAKNIDGTFPNYLNDMYLGGEIRVNAAAKLLSKYPEANFIVVGGFNEKNIGIAGTSKKADDTVDFLKGSNNKASIQVVYSLPCTHHNFVAVFNYWKNNKISPRNVGILTNEYHIPRAIKFAELSAQSIMPDKKISFIPIAAESIDSTFALDTDNATLQTAYTRRLEHEKKGLNSLDAGEYADYCLTRGFELLKDLIYENPDYLLTAAEKLALNLK